MRTTLNTIYSRIQTNLAKITTDMSKINSQISSGEQMSKISDNPVNLVSALSYRSSISEMDQYTENIQYGNTIITTAELALTQMKELTLRAKTLAIQATDPGYTTTNREAIAEEIENMFEQAVSLANTQVNGKYIFGGYRTAGYTDIEPEPFMVDKGDGHWINGTELTPLSGAPLTGTIPAIPLQDIDDGDLLINDVSIGQVIMPPAALVAPDFGLNMGGADALRTAINGQSATTGVTAQFTTLYSGAAPTPDTVDATDSEFTFDLNGIPVTVTTADGGDVVAATLSAINALTDLTGVQAERGLGTNGGDVDTVVFRNAESGDEAAIEVTNFTPVAGDADPGFGNFNQAADATHNTGEITLSSTESYTLTSPNNTTDDNILDILGLGGGSVGIGFQDVSGDGTLVYGYRLDEGDLSINGLTVPDATDDGLSTRFSDASAAAKAAAINSITDDTGVTAVVVNAEIKATNSVTAGTVSIRPTGTVTNTVIRAGDLAINGTSLTTDIDSGTVTYGLNMEKAANAQTAINLESATTDVTGLLTTLLPNSTAATPGVGATAVSFKVNGIDIDLTTGGFSDQQTATDVVAAINAVKSQTGVEARVGDDANGGVDNSIVLFNSVKGNEGAIIISDLDSPAEDFLGLANNDPLGQGADSTHNTGEIALDSTASITITSPTTAPGADTIINELGFSSLNVTGFGGQTSTTSTVNGLLGDIAAGILYVNGTPTTADIVADVAPASGVYMGMAASAKTQIEAADPTVQVQLTTMTQATAATANATADSEISFQVNGEPVTVSYLSTALDSEIAALTVEAINDVSTETGVQAYVGTGAADGTPEGSAALNVIVFKNLTGGNDTTISISAMKVNAGNNDLGFTDFSQAADATHNSGEITISSDTTFDLSTPAVANDSILNELGLGFGALSGYAEKADGIFYSSDGTGEGLAILNAAPTFMDTGDLTINGEDIFITPTAVLENDQTNSLIDVINAKTSTTGVQASRGSDGVILLTAIDGRNVHIETSTNGEAITHLTGGSRDQVTFGTLQLRSDRKFFLETVDPTIDPNEPGLITLGLAGGETISGEPDDMAGDGKIDVFSIHDRTGSVRYAGDRVNDLEIKIGKISTMTIGANGKDGIMDTTIFTTLKALENYLVAENFTTVTGIHKATNTTVGLNSKTTGLEPESQLPSEDLFTKGSFTISIIDHDYPPPGRQTSLTIGVDPSVDTLESVTKRIDGLPHVKASWTNGKLTIEADDPDRYTLTLTNDSSNFLTATGVSSEFMQSQGIIQSIADLDILMENLTNQVSDFGARANRIDIQSQIYSSMNITSKENLSEVQDTDMIKAIMDLKSKETAYQAALSAAAKTMQLSLVDYLK